MISLIELEKIGDNLIDKTVSKIAKSKHDLIILISAWLVSFFLLWLICRLIWGF